MTRDGDDGKHALRQRLRAERKALPATARMAAAEAIVTQAKSLPTFDRAGYVAGYWAMHGELPLHALQMRLSPTQIWCLPVTQPDGRLAFAPWRAGDPLLANRYGIPEPAVEASSLLAPADMSVVLLPLLGFRRDGSRLGMGGGYYDRSFAFRKNAAAPPALIGVAYAFQEIDALATDPWDVALDAVLTEREAIVCGR
ncbi:5-formyltetrahydrofolate cyclo-ligase [Arenimonas sp.]|uniref:5-formyltetrahydrofolate cyclo-ligase n=1 Tax=Arenimonas sp. TaxID=1872635 RepID=UPI0039E5F793